MLTCKLDGAEFENVVEAASHIRKEHEELIDEALQEFIPEAEEIVYEKQIEEEE